MKKAIGASLLVFVQFFLLHTNAYSATYEFSYEFYQGTKVTGTVTGTAAGNLLTDLSNIEVSVDGVPLSESPLYQFGWQPYPSLYTLGAASMSFDGLENNFLLTVNPASSFGENSYFWLTQYMGGMVGGLYVPNVPINMGIGWMYDIAKYDPSKWSLVEVSPVPLPGAMPLMLSGLGLMLGLKRRRRNKGEQTRLNNV